MIEIDKLDIDKRLHKAQMMYNDALQYFNTVKTDEYIDRYAKVLGMLNTHLFLLEHSYQRLNNLIKQTI
jgi:hypothetical protein